MKLTKPTFLLGCVVGGMAAAVTPLLLTASRADTRLLPFQGRLTDAAGVAIPDGAKVVEFKIYDAPTGGNVKWAGEVHKLSVNGGLVNTMLGSKASLGSVDFSTPTYLQITIDANNDDQITAADPPLLPRQSVVPAAYAAVTGQMQYTVPASGGKPAGVASKGWEAVFDNGSPDTGRIPATKLVDNSITAGQLASGAVTTPALGTGAVTTTVIANGTIQAEDLSEGLQHSVVPPGTVMAYVGKNEAVPPPGWLYCRGQSVKISEYPALHAAIGETFGGNGTTTFIIPNGQGLVLRGSGSQEINGHLKQGPARGTIQEDQMQRLKGDFRLRGAGRSADLVYDLLGVFNKTELSGASRSVLIGDENSESANSSNITFDSYNSTGARVAPNGDLAKGETRVSSLGVSYIIKY